MIPIESFQVHAGEDIKKIQKREEKLCPNVLTSLVTI